LKARNAPIAMRHQMLLLLPETVPQQLLADRLGAVLILLAP